MTEQHDVVKDNYSLQCPNPISLFVCISSFCPLLMDSAAFQCPFILGSDFLPMQMQLYVLITFVFVLNIPLYITKFLLPKI